MDSVIRGLVVYFFLLVVFRMAGKRTLAQSTNFDLVLLLIISETAQQAMIDGDNSITNAFLLILTLIGSSVVLSHLKQRWKALDKWLDGTPVVVMQDGVLLEPAARKLRVGEEEILAAARRQEGLERLDDIRYAVMEASGEITIVPSSR